MKIITELNELTKLCREIQRTGKTIGLVPTMGYLHEGHLSLIRLAKNHSDVVIVSRFVNPTQFAKGEDLENYPTDAKKDHELSLEAGADIMFEPISTNMYLENHGTWVEVPKMAKFLCGKTRPSHFRGVCTVLTKLFLLTGADLAVFGEKDWQQLAIIKSMVKDLNFPIKIVGGKIIRELDGLAMSSRNAYLKPEERALAHHINKGLILMQQTVLAGESNSAKLVSIYENYLAENISIAKVDYVSIFDQETIIPQKTVLENSRVAVAIYLGQARLLDNLKLEPKKQ